MFRPLLWLGWCGWERLIPLLCGSSWMAIRDRGVRDRGFVGFHTSIHLGCLPAVTVGWRSLVLSFLGGFFSGCCFIVWILLCWVHVYTSDPISFATTGQFTFLAAVLLYLDWWKQSLHLELASSCRPFTSCGHQQYKFSGVSRKSGWR